MDTNKKISRAWIAGVVVTLLLVAFYVFPKTVSDPSTRAVDIQVHTILDGMKTAYAQAPSIPSGDLTAAAVYTGAFRPKTPDAQDAMSHLKITTVDGHFKVINEFGGDVRVEGQGGKVVVAYTMVPPQICRAISDLLCR